MFVCHTWPYMDVHLCIHHTFSPAGSMNGSPSINETGLYKLEMVTTVKIKYQKMARIEKKLLAVWLIAIRERMMEFHYDVAT